jgi:hypothetical protein
MRDDLRHECKFMTVEGQVFNSIGSMTVANFGVATMSKPGKVVFIIGISLAVIMGIIASFDPGFVCQLDSENLPTTLWSYWANASCTCIVWDWRHADFVILFSDPMAECPQI